MSNLISIIIPCYNAEKYVERSVLSCIQQTYKDIEIIVVDDGSTDRSLMILQKIAKKESRLHVIHIENHGVSYARNIGLQKAQGKYIMFLDADDFYYMDSVELLYSNLGDCDFSIGLIGKRQKTHTFSSYIYDREQFIKLYTFGNHRMGFWCGFYKSDIIKKHNIKFPEDYKYAEDYVFCMRYMFRCRSVKMLFTPVYNYVDVETSAMHKITDAQFKSIDAVSMISDEANNLGIDNFYLKLYVPRNILALMKILAKANEKELYKQLCKKYYRRYLMFCLFKNVSWGRIKVGSFLACLGPSIFFSLIRKTY